jgi:hypothetical protein
MLNLSRFSSVNNISLSRKKMDKVIVGFVTFVVVNLKTQCNIAIVKLIYYAVLDNFFYFRKTIIFLWNDVVTLRFWWFLKFKLIYLNYDIKIKTKWPVLNIPTVKEGFLYYRSQQYCKILKILNTHIRQGSWSNIICMVIYNFISERANYCA